MPNHTEDNPDSALWATLALIAAGTGLNALVSNWDQGAGHALQLTSHGLASYSAFVWYCRDSNAYRFPRSLWRNMCFNGLAVIFVPWYLLRTRSPGHKIAALFRLAAFLFLIPLAALVGYGLGAAAGMLV